MPGSGPVTHGLTKHPLYQAWQDMMRRCDNPRRSDYKNYGGRGIKVCAEWHDVAAFITWIEANLGLRPDGKTLDRINNDGDYEPGNVQWSTRLQQTANRRPAIRWYGVYEQLKTGIKDGTYPPRTPLPTARQLKTEHGLDQDTIGRAFKRLQAEGLVVQIPGRGPFVAPRA